MSMKFFTLSAVCMLVLCMLLALSGTTDFPGDGARFGGPEFASAVVSQEPGPIAVPWEGAAPERPAQGSTPQTAVRETQRSPAGLLLSVLGIGFIMGWIVLSFKLFSSE